MDASIAIQTPATLQSPGLSLRSPLVRYTLTSESRPAEPHSAATQWRRAGDGAWEWSDGVLKLSVQPSSAGSDACNLLLSASAQESARIALCALEFAASCSGDVYGLNRFLRWVRVEDTVVTGDFTPLVVKWMSPEGRTMELRALRGTIPCHVWRDSRELRFRIYLDAAALHPRWHFDKRGRIPAAAATAISQGLEVCLRVSIGRDRPQDPAPIPGRFPRGSEACLTITDHCDFDSPERLDVFLHGEADRKGWLNRGLRFTKGVFALRGECAGVPCLEDEEYRSLIQELRDDGSEIAPHALRHSGAVDGPTFQRVLGELSENWRPETWIDHGYAPYCYATGGSEDERYHLLDELRRHRFTALWAYHDVPADARVLNLLSPERATAFSVVGQVLSHTIHGHAGKAIYAARTAVEQRLQGASRSFIQELLSSIRIVATSKRSLSGMARQAAAVSRILGSVIVNRSLLSEPYTLDELVTLTPVAYPERAAPLHQAKEDDLLLFCTTDVAAAAEAYTHENLRRLLRERGVHIGHSYLLNEHPYIAGLFERDHGRPRIKSSWYDFLDSLEDLVAEGAVWSLAASDLMKWMRSVQQVSCAPDGACSVALTNSSANDIRDFTVLLPRAARRIRWGDSEPRGLRHWGDWIAVWGDLPARRTVTVRWANAETHSHAPALAVTRQ